MNVLFIVVVVMVAAAALTIAYALSDFGAEDVVARFGRLSVRTVTFGRVRLANEDDDPAAIAVAAFTVIGLFLLLLLLGTFA